MSRLFISHSSRNNDWAIALGDWLVREGWCGEDDIFLDVDPARGIAAGERWQKAFADAVTRCEAVLFLVSKEWLGSRWCHDEYQLASNYNKKLFGLLIDEVDLDDLPAGLKMKWQVVRLTGEPAERFVAVHPHTQQQWPVHIAKAGLAQLRSGLQKAGIGPETFDLRPDANGPFGWRAPYRGLEALEPEDAAVFFGRSADIVRGMDALRGLAARKAPRLMVILGASGAGKSSFLRAGLWPRLKLDDAQWMPLRAIRAGRGGAIEGEEGLLAALEEVHRRFGLRTSRADLRQRLASAEAFLGLLRDLRAVAAKRVLASAPPYPLPVLCLDQGEEVFGSDAGGESERLVQLIRAAIDADEALALVSIRSDAYGHMQNAKALSGVEQKPLSLGPVPQGEVARVIREPAEILRRKVGPEAPLFDAAVIERLQEEMEGEADALPLLAFVLQRLMREHAGTSVIGVAQLQSSGGLTAAIESEAEAAFKDAGSPADRAQRREVLRRLFVPRLARISRDSKEAQRRVTLQSDLPADLLPLAHALTERRLLIVRAAAEGATGATLEVAHEALLRRWATLAEILGEDRDALLLLDGVVLAAEDWKKADAVSQPDFLAHRGSRLAEAQALASRGPDWARVIAPARDYLAACQASEEAERAEAKQRQIEREEEHARRLKDARRLTRVIGAALVAALMLLGAAIWFGYVARKEANLALANQSLQLARESRQEASRGHSNVALLLALEGLPKSLSVPERPLVHQSVVALSHAIFEARGILRTRAQGEISSIFAISPDERWYFGADLTGAIIVHSLSASDFGHQIAKITLDNHLEAIVAAQVNRESTTAAVLSATGEIYLVDTKKWTVRHISDKVGHLPTWLSFDPNGLLLAVGDASGDVTLFDAVSGNKTATLSQHRNIIISGAFDSSGKHLVTASYNGDVVLWDVPTKTVIRSIKVSDAPIMDMAIDSNHGMFAVASEDELIHLYGLKDGTTIRTLANEKGNIQKIEFSNHSESLVGLAGDGSVALWDLKDGSRRSLIDSSVRVKSIAINRGSTLLATADADGSVDIWDTISGIHRAVYQENTGGVPASIGFLPVSDSLYSRGADGYLVVRTATDQKSIRLTRGDNQEADSVFSPNSTDVFIGYRNGDVEEREVSTFSVARLVKRAGSAVSGLAYPTCGQGPIIATTSGRVRVWRGSTFEYQFVMPEPSISIVVDRDCRIVANILVDGRIDVRELGSPNPKFVLTDGQSIAIIGAISDDANLLAASDGFGSIIVWNLHDGKKLIKFRAGNDRISGIAFTKSSIVTVSWDGMIKWWSKADFKLQKQYDAGSPLVALAIGEDDKTAVTGDWSGRVALWSIIDRRQLKQWRAHKEPISSLAYSSQAGLVLTGSEDKSAALWDAGTGEALTRVMNFDGPVVESMLSKNGNWILSNGGGTDLRLWRGLGTVEEMIAEARRLLTRPSLTREERRQFAVGAEDEPERN